MSKRPVALMIAAILAGVACTQASALTLDFKGTVLPGSQGIISSFAYEQEPIISFDGQPVDFLVTLAGAPGHLYVSEFSLTWSDTTYSLPYITSWTDVGYPDDLSDSEIGSASTVDIGSSGGSISIYPTDEAVDEANRALRLMFNYVLSSPQSPVSSFTDNAVSGEGSLHALLTYYYDPTTGPYDADSFVTFSVSSVTEVAGVPELATWTTILCGFFMIGGAFRYRRREMKSGA